MRKNTNGSYFVSWERMTGNARRHTEPIDLGDGLPRHDGAGVKAAQVTLDLFNPAFPPAFRQAIEMNEPANQKRAAQGLTQVAFTRPSAMGVNLEPRPSTW